MKMRRRDHFKLFDFEVKNRQEADEIIEKLLRAYALEDTGYEGGFYEPPKDWTPQKKLQDLLSEWYVEQRRCPLVHLNLSDKGYYYKEYDVQIEPHQLVCWVDSYQ